MTSISTSWRDRVYGRVYALELEAEGKTRRISVVEGVRREGCLDG